MAPNLLPRPSARTRSREPAQQDVISLHSRGEFGTVRSRSGLDGRLRFVAYRASVITDSDRTPSYLRRLHVASRASATSVAACFGDGPLDQLRPLVGDLRKDSLHDLRTV